MRKFEDHEREIVTRRECVQVICDMCRRIAESPELEDMAFEWGSVGTSGGSVTANYSIDGEFDSKTCDLCHDCASWVIDEIKGGRLKRPSA